MLTAIFSIIAGLLTLGIAIFTWKTNKTAQKKKAVADEDQKISDAVDSHDGARIDSAIDELRS